MDLQDSLAPKNGSASPLLQPSEQAGLLRETEKIGWGWAGPEGCRWSREHLLVLPFSPSSSFSLDSYSSWGWHRLLGLWALKEPGPWVSSSASGPLSWPCSHTVMSHPGTGGESQEARRLLQETSELAKQSASRNAPCVCILIKLWTGVCPSEKCGQQLPGLPINIHY